MKTRSRSHDHGGHGHEGHDHAGHDAHGHGSHDHGSLGHTHAPSADADRKLIVIALILLSGFLVIEVVLGFKAQSLALLTDAGHMLTDVAALVLALYALRMAARPAKGRYTFGFKRAEILSAQANGMTLILLGAWFLYEGIHRLFEPPEVEGALVLAVAIAGIVVNVIATVLLNRADRRSLNVEGAYQHILTDLYAFIGTAVSGLVVLTTGWARADAVAAMIVAATMLRSGSILLIRSSRVLLEAAPSGVDPEQVAERMRGVDGVSDIHDLHIWEVTSGFPSLSAHVIVEEDRDCHAVRQGVQRELAGSFDVAHSTLQVDHASDSPLTGLAADGCCVDPHDYSPTSHAGAGHS